MTTTLDCPKCGAPLSFEPNPGDETVVCSYCNETVIIPEELRIPLPQVVYVPQPPPTPSTRPNWVIMGLALIGVCALCVILFMISDSSSQSTADLPTESATFDSRSATLEAKATVAALQPLLKQVQSWPASFTDHFLDNSHGWETGDVRDRYLTGNRSLADGTYTWNFTAVQSRFDSVFPDIPDQENFYAGVDLKYILMPDDPDADAGLVFRYNSTDETWYYFSINDKGQYYFGWYDGKNWHSLIHETSSAAIHPGQTNRLAVGAQGSQFIFTVNDQMVDYFSDGSLKSGSIGVGINLPKAGEKSTVVFANFSVLFPSPNP